MSFHHLSDATRRPLRVWILGAVAATVLAGCGGGGRQAIVSEPSFIPLTEAQPFVFALQQRYLELSSRAYDRGDRRGADFYALRSILAIEGKAVDLAAPQEFRLSGPVGRDADMARMRLLAVFQEGARLYAPEDAARAQALYDCWIREAGAGDRNHAATCQGAALTAIARLEAASRGAPRLVGEFPAPGFAVGPQFAQPHFVEPPFVEAPMIGASPMVQGQILQEQTMQAPPISGPVVSGPSHGAAPAPSAPNPAPGFAIPAQQTRPYANYQTVAPYESAGRPSPSAPYAIPSYVASVDAAPGGRVLSLPPQGLGGPLPAPQARAGGVISAPAPQALPGPVMAPPSWSGAQTAGYVQAPLQEPPAYASLGPVVQGGGEVVVAPPSGLPPSPAPRGEDLRILFPAPMGSPSGGYLEPGPATGDPTPLIPAPQPTQPPSAPLQIQTQTQPQSQRQPARTPAPPSTPLIEGSAPAAQVVSPRGGGGDAGESMASAAQSRPRGLPVFFEFNSDRLTPEAEDILNDVAEEAKRQKTKRISIAGFTDSAGSARYNQLLAMRRAQAVRQALERRLGSSVVFEVLPAGESGQASATGDEVREAANRRVEVALTP